MKDMFGKWLATPSPPGPHITRHAVACAYAQCGYVAIRPTKPEADAAITAHRTDHHPRAAR
ncbi:MAG: hypothetical protein ACREOF_12870 [Gemmatimonadales bacterium]